MAGKGDKSQDPYRGRSGNTGIAAFDTIRGPIGWWAVFIVAGLLLFFAALVHALPELRSTIFYAWPAAVYQALAPAATSTAGIAP